MDISSIVDLSRYPIDQPNSSECQAIIKQAKESLAHDGCALLKGFLKPETVTKLVNESNTLACRAKATDKPWGVYPPYRIDENEVLSSDHPRKHQGIWRNRFVTYDWLTDDSTLRCLYKAKEMTDFTRRCLGLDVLYHYGDPLGACVFSIHKEGDEVPWHFDLVDFTVSILLQKPKKGGEFQYAPFIRNEFEENYDRVKKVLSDDSNDVVTLELNPGDLQLFRGNCSIHRVTVASGTIDRLIALMGYCDISGKIGDENLQLEHYGRVKRVPLMS